MEAAIGIEPMDKGFADLCLTTWLRRLNCQTKGEGHSCRLLESGLRLKFWSGRRDLNPRLRPWQGRTLPLSYSRLLSCQADYIEPLKTASNQRFTYIHLRAHYYCSPWPVASPPSFDALTRSVIWFLT